MDLCRRLLAMAVLTGALAIGALASPAVAAPVTIRVAYAYPQNFTELTRDIVKRFEAANPDIKVELLPPKKDYEELVQDTLRLAVTGQPLADVAFHGLHRVRLLAEQGVIVPLDDFINGETSWPQLGYIASMQRLGELGGRNYALSFAVSIMVAHYNADLVQRAGGDPANLPSTWEGILDLARSIQALGGVQGVYWSYYDTANNWTFQSLLQSHGGQMMTPDDRTIAFDGPAGHRVLELARAMGQLGMVDMTDAQAVQSFSAGTLGIFLVSSSRTESLARAAGGHFRYVTAPLPVPVENDKFPAGGSGAMLQARDPRRQKAAWEFIKFAAGPVGQTIMVRNSGYMPGNQLPLDDPELLGSYYDQHPNHRAPITQLPRMTRFYAFPGKNSLKIPNVIRDHLQSVVTLRRLPEAVMSDMVRDVQGLLPR
jgi:multiple sugar transport system substrate-binding protein